jgi:hypothetical protein
VTACRGADLPRNKKLDDAPLRRSRARLSAGYHVPADVLATSTAFTTVKFLARPSAPLE